MLHDRTDSSRRMEPRESAGLEIIIMRITAVMRPPAVEARVICFPAGCFSRTA